MAAASATMGSYTAAAGLVGCSRAPSTTPTYFMLPRRQQQPMHVVRCQSDQQQQPSATPPPPQPKKTVTTTDLLAFGGPAPERINGRLAMVGFVSALAVEASRGDGLFAQLGDGAGVPLFLGTAALLTAASLVPLYKGISAQSRSDGLMTADAEMWNGRFAMLGLVALAFTEYVTGSPLV